MSVKSERREWFAANVEAKPAGEVAGSDNYQAWVKRANVHMRKICVPGSAELLPEIAAVQVAVPEIAAPAFTGRIASAAAPSSADRAEYDSFVDAQLRAFGDHTDAPGGYSDDIWDRHAVANCKSSRSFEPFKGSLKSALPYLNGDAKDALDRGVIRWVTFAEFKLERAAIRAAEAEAAAEPQDCTLCLAADCGCDAIEWAA